MAERVKGVLGRIDATSEEVREAMGYAVAEALAEHKRIGNPVAVWDWENSRVVLVPPEEIAVPQLPELNPEADTAPGPNGATNGTTADV